MKIGIFHSSLRISVSYKRLITRAMRGSAIWCQSNSTNIVVSQIEMVNSMNSYYYYLEIYFSPINSDGSCDSQIFNSPIYQCPSDCASCDSTICAEGQDNLRPYDSYCYCYCLDPENCVDYVSPSSTTTAFVSSVSASPSISSNDTQIIQTNGAGAENNNTWIVWVCLALFVIASIFAILAVLLYIKYKQSKLHKEAGDLTQEGQDNELEFLED